MKNFYENFYYYNLMPADASPATRRMVQYLASKSSYGFSILERFAVAKQLLDHGSDPFYAADVFGSFPGLGARMNNLSNYLVVATGNVKTGTAEVDALDWSTWPPKQVKKEIELTSKEWRLIDDLDEMRDAYEWALNLFKQAVTENL